MVCYRSEFLRLPHQASECFLAGVKPPGGEYQHHTDIHTHAQLHTHHHHTISLTHTNIHAHIPKANTKCVITRRHSHTAAHTYTHTRTQLHTRTHALPHTWLTTDRRLTHLPTWIHPCASFCNIRLLAILCYHCPDIQYFLPTPSTVDNTKHRCDGTLAVLQRDGGTARVNVARCDRFTTLIEPFPRVCRSVGRRALKGVAFVSVSLLFVLFVSSGSNKRV